MIIRTATPEDAGEIARVHVEGWQSTYRAIVQDSFLATLDIAQRTGRWREILNSTSPVLVAEEGEGIVGFANGGRIREPIGECGAELVRVGAKHLEIGGLPLRATAFAWQNIRDLSNRGQGLLR